MVDYETVQFFFLLLFPPMRVDYRLLLFLQLLGKIIAHSEVTSFTPEYICFCI